jgi:hypothetical protein
MNDLLDRLQELADAYARQASPPGPAAARRRSRARRRAAAVALAGVLVAAVAAIGLLWPAREPPTPPLQTVGPQPTRPLQPPRSTAWFRPTYLPRGFRFNAAGEYPKKLLGLPIPGARSFRGLTRVRGARAQGELTVSVNPQLHALDVAREARTYPTVRVVRVRGRAGLLFPARSGNFTSGLTWLEQPGVVAQVAGWNVPDAALLRVTEGLRITTARGQPTIEVGALPASWRPTEPGKPAAGGNELVLPRTYIQTFTLANPNKVPTLSVRETRDRYGPLPPAQRQGEHQASSPRPPSTPATPPATTGSTAWTTTMVRGHPAVVSIDRLNNQITVTWREPGGIELSVAGDQRIGLRELLAVAEGMRQP